MSGDKKMEDETGFEGNGDTFDPNAQQMSQQQFEQMLAQYQSTGGVIDPQFSKFKDAGLFGANQAADLYSNGGLPERSFGEMSQQSFDMVNNISNQGHTTNALNTMNGMLDNTNPFAKSFGNMQTNNPNGFNQQSDNPFMQGFQNFGNQQNEAFQGAVNNALDNVQDRVNSQFAGRNGSAMHNKTMADSLGNTANQMHSNNFNSNQNRNLQAMQGGSNAFNSDFGNNLAGTGFNSNQWQQGFNNKFGNNQAQSNIYNQDRSNQFNSAVQLPNMQNGQYQGAVMANQFGGQQDEMTNYNNERPYNSLDRYAGTLAQLNGTQPVAQNRPKSSTTDRLLGLGMGFAGLGGVSGIKSLF